MRQQVLEQSSRAAIPYSRRDIVGWTAPLWQLRSDGDLLTVVAHQRSAAGFVADCREARRGREKPCGGARNRSQVVGGVAPHVGVRAEAEVDGPDPESRR